MTALTTGAGFDLAAINPVIGLTTQPLEASRARSLPLISLYCGDA